MEVRLSPCGQDRIEEIGPDQRAGKGPASASDQELAAALDSRIPVVNFVVGFGGIAILVWLMMKPF